MPKSKVRKRSEYSPPASVLSSSTSSKQLAPSPSWYPVVMLIVFLIGLAWISVYYIAGERIPLMQDLNAWNFAVGFGFLVLGLVMAVRWR
ncbi:MAG: cell division protein CrgA [bacterium]